MPWPDRLAPRLRRLYRAAEPDPSDLSSSPLPLEQDLMAIHARRHGAPRAAPGFLRAHRWSLSCGALALALAAACQLPVDYDRAFGLALECRADAGEQLGDAVMRGLADRLKALTGADRVAVRAMVDHAGPGTLRLDLWDADAEVDADALIAEVDDLAPGRCEVVPLVGTVHGTLGGRLGHELFDLELLDRDDAEAARQQILEQLEARGMQGEAEVEISDAEDGRREVKIRVEARHPPHP